MRVTRIPADKKIDPSKLDAWIQMNTVHMPVHKDGPAFIYIKDIAAEISSPETDPVRLQAAIDDKAVHKGDPTPGMAFIYLDDLMMGFGGSRLEPDEVIRAAAVERLRQEELRRQRGQ